MKTVGWIVNLTMRRVEPVHAKDSHLNRGTYGLYQGPKRTYMLHDDQVYGTEAEATYSLVERMAFRYTELAAKLQKYEAELRAARNALNYLMVARV